MARGRRRVVSFNTNRRLLPSVYTPRRNLGVFEDRRFFHPEAPYAPARSFSKTRHRIVYPTPVRRVKRSAQNISYPSPHVVFANSPKVLICVRRKIRKEVLHAYRKTGKVGQKRPRRNFYSDIHC